MKTFKTILAVAVAAMAFVGCAKEQNVELNEKVTMTYSVSLDSASGTRADFDGSKANELAYAAYLKVSEGVYSDTPVATGTAEVSNGSATVNIELLKGQQYLVTFFAYNNADANKWWTLNNNILTFDHSVILNKDVNDVDVFVGKTESQSVTLKRPLAQVNLYLSETDVTKATALGFKTDGGVTFTLSNMATTYDLRTGTASGSAGVQSYSGAVAAAANGYHHLGSALVLGGQNVEGKINSIGNVQYGSTPHSVPGIPTAANHKTNVKFSSLLVGSVAYSVTLTTGFDGTEDKVIPQP